MRAALILVAAMSTAAYADNVLHPGTAELSFQPIYGGPAYAIRNVLVNVADEEFKLHANGSTPTVGAVIYHTTVLRDQRAIQCSTANEPLYFTIENSVFEGPATIADGHTVRWDVPSVATASTDYNGYAPDGQFEFGYGTGGMTYANFAALQAAGTFEQHGLLLGATSGIADWHTRLDPRTPQPDATAIDKGVVLPNIDDGYTGSAPDLGAIEAGCDAPIYGPRPAGMDESNEPVGCAPPGSLSDDVAHGDDPAGGGGSKAGGCCQGSPASSSIGLAALVLVFVRKRRDRRA